jgi:hypothetical protein
MTTKNDPCFTLRPFKSNTCNFGMVFVFVNMRLQIMYIFIVLMLMGVEANGTATLSFIFPDLHERDIIQEVEKISEPAMRVSKVVENEGILEIDLVSREELCFSFDVLYDDGSIESYSGGVVDGCSKLEVPIVLSGSRREIRWVNILWEGDGLVICNAAHENAAYENTLHENLPELSLSSAEKFEKN